MNETHVELAERFRASGRHSVINSFLVAINSSAALRIVRAFNGDVFNCVLAAVRNFEFALHDVIEAGFFPGEFQLCSGERNVLWVCCRGSRRSAGAS